MGTGTGAMRRRAMESPFPPSVACALPTVHPLGSRPRSPRPAGCTDWTCSNPWGGLHRERGRPCRPPAPPRPRLIPGCLQAAFRLHRTWQDQSSGAGSKLTSVNHCDRPGCRGWVRNPGGTNPSGSFTRTFTRSWLRSGARTRPASRTRTALRIPGARTLAPDLTP